MKKTNNRQYCTSLWCEFFLSKKKRLVIKNGAPVMVNWAAYTTQHDEHNIMPYSFNELKSIVMVVIVVFAGNKLQT